MVTNEKVFIIDDYNLTTINTLHKQLGYLLGVGKRADGRYHQSDMCQAKSINLLSKFKPTNAKDYIRTSITHRGDSSNNGYFLGYDCYGVKKPYLRVPQFQMIGPNGHPTTAGGQVTGVRFLDLEGDWQQSNISVNRIRDFDNYAHVPQNNQYTNSVKPFVVSFRCTNPDGAIAADATMRYNWKDIVHKDGISATLGMESLFACDTVNDKAYLGVVAYRTQAKTPNTNKFLLPIGVAKISKTPLGAIGETTGQESIHNVHFSIDDLIVGFEGDVTDGYDKFYYGETGIQCIPFIAKHDGSSWYAIGLGVSPFKLGSALVANGGAGSQTNTVAIDTITCKLTCVKLSTGNIQLGIQDNADFTIKVTGNGLLAFPKDNIFQFLPADGNSTIKEIAGLRLGTQIGAQLDMVGITVSSGQTYNAQSLFWGRDSNPTYKSAPTTTFVPYDQTTPFKVGIQIAYYKYLTTWTYLGGNITINPSNLLPSYTITIHG